MLLNGALRCPREPQACLSLLRGKDRLYFYNFKLAKGRTIALAVAGVFGIEEAEEEFIVSLGGAFKNMLGAFSSLGLDNDSGSECVSAEAVDVSAGAILKNPSGYIFLLKRGLVWGG